MNIEIANRLVNLRKTNNYSQEALAEKLGISRQAVSKWERAEASPDTDNLILLARLYKVSLDELLSTQEEIQRLETDTDLSGEEEEVENSANQKDREKREFVHVSLKGIHVKDKDGSEVHVGWDGIHVDDFNKNENIHVNKDGVYVNGRKCDKHYFKDHHEQKFPMALLITIAYLFIGGMFHLWHPGWLLFLLIPIWYSFVEAVHKKDAHQFAYPVVTVLLFLMSVIFLNNAHPAWVIFLTIPLYYSLISYIREQVRRRRGNETRGQQEEKQQKDDGEEKEDETYE